MGPRERPRGKHLAPAGSRPTRPADGPVGPGRHRAPPPSPPPGRSARVRAVAGPPEERTPRPGPGRDRARRRLLVAAAVAVVAVAAAVGAATLVGGGRSVAPGVVASRFLAAHGGSVVAVAAAVGPVASEAGLLAEGDGRAGTIEQLAALADAARQRVGADAAVLAASAPGSGPYRAVAGGAAGLRTAMAAFVTYSATPNPATLAVFLDDYASASAEWNSGVTGLWRSAGRSGPPTVPAAA